MADYNAYLVRIWRATDTQHLRIVVQDAHTKGHLAFDDFTTLLTFLAQSPDTDDERLSVTQSRNAASARR